MTQFFNYTNIVLYCTNLRIVFKSKTIIDLWEHYQWSAINLLQKKFLINVGSYNNHLIFSLYCATMVLYKTGRTFIWNI